MLDAAILFLVVLIGYLFLRSYGGEGFTARGQFAPAHTPEGKRDRAMAWSIVALIVAVITFVAMRQEGGNWSNIIVPVLMGGLVYLIIYLKKNKG